MGEQSRATLMLIGHFFRRFFDNDTIHVEGDTLTTVVRALSIVAAPGLMVSFFLQNKYASSSTWTAIEDEYFFVMLSFVVMGAVSIFEWEMLFPDRLDFLVLSPLPLKPLKMLAAKATALVIFLTLFLVSSNIFAALILPLVSKGNFFRHLYAHGAAVLLAGFFAVLLYLAIGSVLLCVLNATQFRRASALLQLCSVTLLGLLVMQYAMLGNLMQVLLKEPLGWTRWIPPYWFLGLYEQLLHGNSAPPFAHEMSRYAFRGTGIVAATVLLTYPLAWARMRKLTVEGASQKTCPPSQSLQRLLHQIIRRPSQRGIFHFITQTIARNSRYQVYLAVYFGTGLALALALVTSFNAAHGAIQRTLSYPGLHAVLPLLLFWMIAGLKNAFAFPLNLSAGWIFRITGVKSSECTGAARKWVFLCAIGVMCGVLGMLRLAGWNAKQLLIQLVFGVCLCVLLTDGFFCFEKSVPFNRPRMPGRNNFPLLLVLYIGVLPQAIGLVVLIEMVVIEKDLKKLVYLVLLTMLAHAALAIKSRRPEEIEEEMEGYDGEFQILGLS